MNELFEKYIIGRRIISIDYQNDSVFITVEGNHDEETIELSAAFDINWVDEVSNLDIALNRKKVVYEKLVK